MKTLSFWKKSVYSAIIFFSTLLILSVGYGALFGGLTVADKVGSGSGLTTIAWNRIIDGVLDINTRLENLSFSGGNVGIGVSPSAKLEVNGTVKATNFSGIANSLVMIQATATVANTSPNTWVGNTNCPAGYTIIFWGTLASTQYWGGGMTHWYASCQQNGNGIQANLYTQVGYVGHTLVCSGLCAKQ